MRRSTAGLSVEIGDHRIIGIRPALLHYVSSENDQRIGALRRGATLAPMGAPAWQLGVRELAEAYRRAETTPVEVVDVLIERVEALDGRLGAFTTTTFDAARRRARMCVEERARGEASSPLHGIPVAIKELYDVGGAETAYGSTILAGRVPAADAEAVARLRRAGAIVLGLTRSHEFAWGITTQNERSGVTRNPWDLARVPGGSSGGAAAAVAAGLVPLALGSDTGGSIRIPAGFCGISGFKPTYGRVPLEGVCPLAPSLDHGGPLARRVGDLFDAFGVLAGEEGLSPERPPALRLAVCPDLHVVPPTADRQRAFDYLVDAAADSGAALSEVTFAGAESIYETFTTIQLHEAYRVHSETFGLYPERADDYSESIRKRLEMGAAVSAQDYERACERRLEIRARFADLFERSDALLTPLSAGPPSLVERPNSVEYQGRRIALRDLVMHYTVPQNVARLPACAVPADLDHAGLPIGIQVTTGHGEDTRCLSVASWMEEIAGTPAWPPLASEA